MYHRKNYYPFYFITLSLFFFLACQTVKVAEYYSTEEAYKSYDKATMAKEAMELEKEKTQDPKLGYVPRERLRIAYDEMLSIQGKKGKAALSNLHWKECGPSNVGGRTRAILWDPNDPYKKRVFAGGVSGGLWYTDDIYADEPNWVAVDDYLNNLAITTLAHHPSNTDTMYFGTGEGFYNLDAVRGEGIWRSIDGGATWSQLSATKNSNFYYVQKIVVDGSGNVYAGTNLGVWKSTNHGGSWTKILGGGTGFAGSSNRCGDIEVSANGDLYVAMGLIFTSDGIYKSTNAGSNWSKVYTSTSNEERIELACAASSNSAIYAIIQRADTRKALKVMKSSNSGSSWTNLSPPIDGVSGDTFTRNQAWYDLIAAVDPNDDTELYVGGIDLHKSVNSGSNWTQVSHWYGGGGYPEVHADQHAIVFLPGSSDTLLFGNDGGIYLSKNASSSTPSIQRKEFSYRTTQFYSAAVHPEALRTYYLGGSQDNGSLRIQSGGISSADEVTGGDGGFCHIDQQQPDTQITSYVYNQIRITTNGFTSYTSNNITSGLFINPSDYDSDNKILYSAAGSNQLLRRSGIGGSITATNLSLSGIGQVYAVTVSPNTSSNVYVGNSSGDVFKITNANGSPSFSNIGSSSFPSGGYVSCIAIEPGDENHILVTFSNYGVASVWESTNGGTSWSNVEGNLPDMPVRWALFSPIGGDSALLATELGVWSTDNLNSTSTIWGRPSDDGMPSVRVDMLQLRPADSMVLAATHGRGMFSSSYFSNRFVPDIAVDKRTAYIGEEIEFYDQTFGTASSWQWDFDNNGSIDATGERVQWAYGSPGYKSVKLIVNNSDTLIKSQFITVLPNLGTPYQTTDGGNFESNAWHFGSNSLDGGIDLWEKGAASNDFNSSDYNGSNAWVTDLDADIFAGTYRCALYSPEFNMKQTGTYTLSFLKSMAVNYCNAPFAVQVQYSTNKGATWQRLGDENSGTNWYNRGASTCGTCCIVSDVFNDRTGWTTNVSKQTTSYNISSLGGNASVRFRIVLSVAAGYTSFGYLADGFLIDDFAISGPTNIAIKQNIEVVKAIKSELVGPNDSVDFFSPNGKIMATIKNKSTHDFGLTRVEIDTAGIATKNFSTNTDSSRRIMFKTIKVKPTSNDTAADYDIWLYFSSEERDSWESATGYSKFLLNLIKSPTDIDSGTIANTIYGSSPQVVFRSDSGISVRASFSNGFSGFGAGRDGSLGPLNVSWLNFYGERDPEKSTLYWKTATEINNHFFSVERHLGDSNAVELVGQINGAGNSTEIRSYLFEDAGAAAFNPRTLYYRIKQTDFDGKSSTTPWIQLELEKNNASNIAIWPNPVRQRLFIQNSNGQKEVEFRLTDVQGKVIRSGKGKGWFSINVSDLPNGPYFIEIFNQILGNSQSKTFKVLKQ